MKNFASIIQSDHNLTSGVKMKNLASIIQSDHNLLVELK